MELPLSCLWLAIVSWLILRAATQRGLLPRLAGASPPASEDAPQIAVIVPARDEAANIGRCLQSLLMQDYPAERLSFLVVDDHSADETAAIVRRLAADHPRVALLSSPPLPPRWTGKSHACWIGARSSTSGCEWLCFLDADVWGEPNLISSAMRAAQTQRLDLLSLAPHQELRSFAERLIIPCGLILLSFVQDLRRVQSRSGGGVTATGQFMLTRRDAYEAVGGHAAVCSAICEDLEVARRFKQSGRSVLLMDGEAVLSTRMYTGWRTLWPGLAKNLVDTLGGPIATPTLALTAVALAWAAVVIPLIDAASCAHGGHDACAALVVALIGSAAAFGLHIAAAFHFRIPLVFGLLFPLGYSAGALMALDSVRRRLTGRVSWKGRILFMSGSKTARQAVRRPAGVRAATSFDASETRAVLLAAIAIAFFLYFIRIVLLPFVLAGVVAYICTPLLDWLAKRTRLPRVLFAVLLWIVLVTVAGFVAFVAAQHLAAETTSVVSNLQPMLEQFAHQVFGDAPIRGFGQQMDANEIARAVADRIRDWFGQGDRLAIIAGYSLATVMGAILTVVLLIYFLVSGRSVARGLLWMVPPQRRPLVARIWTRLDPVLMRYFLGVIAVVIYATIAAYIGLGLILGIHHAALLALLTGILETVPFVGPTSAAIIAGLVSLQTATGIMSILAYALYATLLRLSIDQVFGPIVLGRAARVHPVLIIFCFLAGGALFGIPGVILAVPVALTVKNTLATIYNEGDQR